MLSAQLVLSQGIALVVFSYICSYKNVEYVM